MTQTSDWTAVRLPILFEYGTKLHQDRCRWLTANTGPMDIDWCCRYESEGMFYRFEIRDPKIATLFILRWT